MGIPMEIFNLEACHTLESENWERPIRENISGSKHSSQNLVNIKLKEQYKEIKHIWAMFIETGLYRN